MIKTSFVRIGKSLTKDLLSEPSGSPLYDQIIDDIVLRTKAGTMLLITGCQVNGQCT